MEPSQPDSRSGNGAADELTPVATSSCVLVLAVFVCTVLAVVGVGTGSALGLLGGLVAIGVAAVATWRLFRRAGRLGRIAVVALGGLVALVVGLLLGIQSYDERYFGDPGERGFWDAVSLVGFLLAVAGFFVTVGAALVFLVAATIWSFRGR